MPGKEMGSYSGDVSGCNSSTATLSNRLSLLRAEVNCAHARGGCSIEDAVAIPIVASWFAICTREAVPLFTHPRYWFGTLFQLSIKLSQFQGCDKQG